MKKWRILLCLTLVFGILASNYVIVSANEKEYITDTAYVEYINLYYNGMMLEQKGVRVIEERHASIVDRNTLEIYVPARTFSVMDDSCEVLWNEEERKVTLEIIRQDFYSSCEYIIGSNLGYFKWSDSGGKSNEWTDITQNPIFIHNGAAMIPYSLFDSYTWMHNENSLCYYDYRVSFSDDTYYDYIDESFLADLRVFLAESEMSEEQQIERYNNYAELGERRKAAYKQYRRETYGETNVDADKWVAMSDLSGNPIGAIIRKTDNEWLLVISGHNIGEENRHIIFEHVLGEEFDKIYYSNEDCQDKFNGIEIMKRNNKYFLNKVGLEILGLKLK